MDASTFENLDLACAIAGKKIGTEPSNERKKLVTDALAVLEEQGVYALFLYLQAQTAKNKEVAEGVRKGLLKFLQNTPRAVPLFSKGDVYDSIKKIADKLDKLLLAHDLLRQSLVYARYHAQPREESEAQT